MAGSSSGEAVLDIRTNDAQFVASLDRAEALSQLLGQSFQKLAKQFQDTGKSVGDTGQQIERMSQRAETATKSFGQVGDRIKEAIENPFGAAKSAMTGLAESLGPVGVGLIAVAGAITAAGAAAFEMAQHAAHIGEDLEHMSEKTGIAVEPLSALKFAADVAGSSLEQISTAVFMLEKNIGEGGDKIEKGLKRIGLSLTALKDQTPDEQFLAIANALHDVHDQAEFAAAGAEIFGKPFRELAPLMKKDLQGLVDEAKRLGLTWSEEDVKAATDFQMEMRKLQAELSGMETHIGRKLVPQLLELVKTLETPIKQAADNLAGFLARVQGQASDTAGQQIDAKQRELFEKMQQLPKLDLSKLQGFKFDLEAPNLPALIQQFTALHDHLEELRKGYAPLTAEQQRNAAEMIRLGDNAETAAKFLGVSKKAVEDFIEAQKKAAEQQRKFSDAWTDANSRGISFRDTLASIDPQIAGSVKYYAGLGASVEELVAMFPGLTKAQAEAAVDAQKFAEMWAEAWREAPAKAFEPLKKKLDELNHFQLTIHPDFQKNEDAAAAARKNVADRLAQIGENELQTQIRHFQEAAQAHKDSLAQFEPNYKETMDAIDADTATAIALAKATWQLGLSDMADATSSWANQIAGWIKTIPTLIQQAFTGGGGLAGAGKAITSGLGAVVGDKLFGNLAASLSNTLASKFGTGITAALGVAIPGIGAAIGSLAGPLLGGVFNKIFHTEEREVNRTRQAFVDAAGGLDALNRKAAAAGISLQRMLQAKTVNDYNAAIKELNDAMQFQDDAMKDLNDTIQKYKFSTEELGPALQRQNLDKQAQELYHDWQVLTSAGIDVAAVAREMGGSIQDFATQALQTGAEIPEAMRPMLQQMADMGELTDAAGHKITGLDAAGFHFSMSMSDGFKALISAVDRLTAAIRRGLGLAADLGTSIGNLPPVPDYSGVNPGDVPMAGGGYFRVPHPVRFLVGERGAEDVVFGGAGRDLAKDVAGELAKYWPTPSDRHAGATVGPIEINLVVDGQVLAHTTLDNIGSGGSTYSKFKSLARRSN